MLHGFLLSSASPAIMRGTRTPPSSPDQIKFKVVKQSDNELTFISPKRKGAYRIFAFIKNEKGQSSVANIPFLVK